jgi:hypothetical protein
VKERCVRLCREQERHQTRVHAQRGNATQICRRKEEGCELDVEEASDKPRRVVVTERGSLRNGKFP